MPSPFSWFDWPAAFAPTNLNQPINSGWSFLTVNEGNSSAPDTERRIVAQDSYGRQIGKLMDVIELLVKEAEKANPDLAENKCISDLAKLKARIDEAKLDAQKTRQERLVEDLLALKRTDEKTFSAVLKAVSLP